MADTEVSTLIQISIHSTARVETLPTRSALYTLAYFNPLHREGGDLCELEKSTDKSKISIHSTARVETMSFIAAILWRSEYFNPLHREGGDQVM